MLLAAGVLLLSLRGGRELAKLDRRAVGFALFTAVTICAYSVVDGIGARLAGPGKASGLFGRAVRRHRAGGAGLCAGAARPRGVPADGAVLEDRARRRRARGRSPTRIAIWAMTVAPIAIVAALRETSVLFGALIAVVVLKEPLRPARIVAALMIVAGLCCCGSLSRSRRLRAAARARSSGVSTSQSVRELAPRQVELSACGGASRAIDGPRRPIACA